MTTPADPNAALKAQYRPGQRWQMRGAGCYPEWRDCRVADSWHSPGWDKDLEYRRHPDEVALTAHADHPARHWDRTCPACNPPGDTVKVGEFRISRYHAGGIWIEAEKGEGGQFNEELFAAAIREFYGKHF